MPPKNWNSTYQKYITDEEADIFKKQDVLKRNKIKYWRKHYPFFIIEKDDYEYFNKVSRHARKIYQIKAYLDNHKKGRLPKTEEQMEFYNKHYKIIKLCEENLHYIKTIKINPDYVDNV